MHKGGTIFSDPIFSKILSIGFEFETHDLAKLSLHKNHRYLVNSDLSLRSLKQQIASGMITEVDKNYLSVKIHLSKNSGDTPRSDALAEPNPEEMSEEEREFFAEYQEEIAQEKLDRYDNESFLEYFNEFRPTDDTNRIKFQITNDIGDVDFNTMLLKECEKLKLPKDQMFVFKTRGGKLYKIKFLEALKKYCGTLSGVEYVITYYEPKKRENPDIILEHFVDACSRIVDHLGNLKHTNGTLLLEGDEKKTHYIPIGNISDSRRLYRKPGTNLFYLETYDDIDTVHRKSLGAFEFIPQMTFRCKTQDGIDIMKAILKPDPLITKDKDLMEMIGYDHEIIVLVDSIVDSLLEAHNLVSEKKILPSSHWYKTIKTYIFLIYYKLFLYINHHNDINIEKEDYLKDHLVFASRHTNFEIYKRVKEILNEHYHITDIDEVRSIFWQPDVLERVYEEISFGEEDYEENGDYKYDNANKNDLEESDKNYGNPLYSLLSYFRYFEKPPKEEHDWLVESGIDSFSTRFDLKNDEILLENRLFKDEIALLLNNKIDLKIKDGLLTVDAMRELVKKLYGRKNLKHMLTAKRVPSKKNVSKKSLHAHPGIGLAQVKSHAKKQAIIAEVIKKHSKSKKSARTTAKTPSHLKQQKRVSAKKRLSIVKEEEGELSNMQ